MTVIPDSDFGRTVRTRLRDETVIWLTTIGADGTPQPNPVWFLWEEDSNSLLTYNANDAHRIDHVAARPRVSANFDGNGKGGDIVVLAGVMVPAPEAPPATEHEAYAAKYAAGIRRIGTEAFAARYTVAMRMRIGKVRGF